MKVLVFDFGYNAPTHIETEAEIAQRHLDEGDQVIRLTCTGDLPICVGNWQHNLAVCVSCVCNRKSIWDLVQPKVPTKSILNLTQADRRAIGGISVQVNTMRDLQRIRFRNFDVGYAAASALVDLLNDPDPDLQPHRTQIQDLVDVSLAGYLSALNHLDQEKPDRVYVISGRWVYTRGVLRACQARGVPCYIHERGGDLHRYYLAANRLPHEIAGTTKDVEELWESADPKERELIGSTYYEEKAKGIERQWFSFVASQTPAQLPEGWDPSRRNIAVFMSSEFEFASIGEEYSFPFYDDQNNGLARIISSLTAAGCPVHLNIRVHPNMKGVRNANIDWVLNLRSPCVTVIPPDAKVSSYALMASCEKVLTFGSTMGIEAVYWGKPSIMAGRGAYQYLEGTYNPESHEAVMELLFADLPPKPRLAALKYGYYWLRLGIEHKYYRPESYRKGKFKGKTAGEALAPFWSFIYRLSRDPRWRYTRPMLLLSKLHRQWQRRRLRKSSAKLITPEHGSAQGRSVAVS